MYLYPLYRMSVVSRVISAHFIPSSVFPLLKKVISSVHNYLITVYCSKSSIVVQHRCREMKIVVKYYTIVVTTGGGGEECFYTHNSFIHKGMLGWHYLVICTCSFIHEMLIAKSHHLLNNIETYMISCKHIHRN